MSRIVTRSPDAGHCVAAATVAVPACWHDGATDVRADDELRRSDKRSPYSDRIDRAGLSNLVDIFSLWANAMYQEHEPSPIDVSPLHRAMRRACRADAVIRTEPDRIVIEFSDGRTHRIPRAHDVAADQLLAAAVHWCRRHGADVVDIRA